MNWLQVLMIVAAIMCFTLLVCSGLAMEAGREGLNKSTRGILMACLVGCLLFLPLAGEACEKQFRESIDKECAQSYFSCVSWEELEAATE